MRINEFHSKLALRKDQSSLFDALRRLRSLGDVKRMDAVSEGGWIVWTDNSTDDPEGGGTFRLATTAA